MKSKLVFLITICILVSGCAIKDCGTNLNCFKEAAKDCSRTRINIIKDGNNIRITSRGEWFGACQVSFKIEEISEELKREDPTLGRVAIGKTLNCAIPIEIVEYDRDKYIEELLNIEAKFDQYCSGPIKDVMKGPLKEVIREKIRTESNS